METHLNQWLETFDTICDQPSALNWLSTSLRFGVSLLIDDNLCLDNWTKEVSSTEDLRCIFGLARQGEFVISSMFTKHEQEDKIELDLQRT